MTALAAPVSRRPRVRHALRMIANDTRKGLQITWSHRATLIPQFGFLTLLYWVIQYFVGGGRIVPQLAAQTIVAYLAFIVAYVALLRMAAGILEEVFSGTFMQSLLSPLRPWVLSLGRLVAAMVEGLITAGVIAVIFVPVVSSSMTFRWQAVITILLTLADAAGFALLIGGLAIAVNSIGAMIHVLWSMLIILNGSYIPVHVMPTWLAAFAKVWPTTLGVDATRQIMFGGASLADLWSSHSLQFAVGHAALMLLLGWVTLNAAIRRGLMRGRLGP